jgi:ADP-heptose:LPS heptosyltransferase
VASSLLFIGMEGFLAHLARAVGVRSVVVYGGYSAPDETGYACNENLYTPVACAPCWEGSRCDNERRCLTAIEPAHVLSAVERTLARPPQPLETTTVSL